MARVLALCLLLGCDARGSGDAGAGVEQPTSAARQPATSGVASPPRPAPDEPDPAAPERTGDVRPADEPAQTERREQAPSDAEPPDPDPKRTDPSAGTVYAHGGGPLGRDHIKAFIEICGGATAKLVVIPTAVDKADDPDYAERVRIAWEKRGVANTTMLHTNDRAEADRAAFTKPLRTADCVWIGGGAQGRLVDRYVGTRVERELFAVLARGGAVGGYSAGMAIMSRVIIRQGNPEPEEALGFGLVTGVVLDQHFLAREREPRLLEMLSRHPDLVGFGVDERTALIVAGGRYRVFGHSVVRRCTKRRGCKDLLPGATGRFP